MEITWRDLAGPVSSPKQELFLLEWLTLFSRLLTKTRHAHQIRALTLTKLQNDDFLKCDILHNDTTKEIWRKNMINKSPTFQYWDTFLHMEIMGLIFVRANREQKFPLYEETLKALVPCCFVWITTIMPVGLTENPSAFRKWIVSCVI